MVSHVCGVNIYPDKKVLGEIFEVCIKGISFLENKAYSRKFLTIASNMGEDKSVYHLKNQITSDNQLVFEFLNKVLLLRVEERNGTSKVDVFLIEVVSSFQKMNLTAIKVNLIDKVVNKKHGLPYRFILNKLFEFFKVLLCRGTLIFNKT